MSRPVLNKAMRDALVGLAVAALVAAGLTSTAAAGPTVSGITAPATEAHPPAGARAAKPYMGWSSYSMQVYSNDGGNWISADQIIAQSDAMHEKLQPYGYEYINIDAAGTAASTSTAGPCRARPCIPNGLQAVIDHIHANGQKVGLYGIPGLSQACWTPPTRLRPPRLHDGRPGRAAVAAGRLLGLRLPHRHVEPVRPGVHRLDRRSVRVVGRGLPEVRQRHAGLR